MAKEDIKYLNIRVESQIANSTSGPKFVPLDKNSLRLLVFRDASFTNNQDLLSQISYVIILANPSNKAKILYWSSTKYKRVARSVLVSKLYAIVSGFHTTSTIKSMIDKVLGTNLLLVLYTDSRLLYNYLVKLSTT